MSPNRIGNWRTSRDEGQSRRSAEPETKAERAFFRAFARAARSKNNGKEYHAESSDVSTAEQQSQGATDSQANGTACFGACASKDPEASVDNQGHLYYPEAAKAIQELIRDQKTQDAMELALRYATGDPAKASELLKLANSIPIKIIHDPKKTNGDAYWDGKKISINDVSALTNHNTEIGDKDFLAHMWAHEVAHALKDMGELKITEGLGLEDVYQWLSANQLNGVNPYLGAKTDNGDLSPQKDGGLRPEGLVLGALFSYFYNCCDEPYPFKVRSSERSVAWFPE